MGSGGVCHYCRSSDCRCEEIRVCEILAKRCVKGEISIVDTALRLVRQLDEAERARAALGYFYGKDESMTWADILYKAGMATRTFQTDEEI